jgi:hypothetical protein
MIEPEMEKELRRVAFRFKSILKAKHGEEEA